VCVCVCLGVCVCVCVCIEVSLRTHAADKNLFFGVPNLATCIFLILYNEPGLGSGIDPDMALTPHPSSIGWGLNPRPSDR
jgi:hypothetical protein